MLLLVSSHALALSFALYAPSRPASCIKRVRGGAPPQASVRRTLDEARSENEAFHREECSRSEKAFFYFDGDSSSEWAATPPAWESFRFGSTPAPAVDCAAPHPFGQGDLAHVSCESLFTAADCEAIIREAETDRAWRGAQPLASYAQNASVFRPVGEMPCSARWLDEQLKCTIYPAVLAAFPRCTALSARSLRCSAASVVKYNASAGQTCLGVHRDGPLVTAIIPLNGLEAYAGGGTYLEALCGSEAAGHDAGVLRRETGHLILHPATLRHGGAPITRGVRYILVLWIFSATFLPHWHYSTQRAARFLASALRIPRDACSAYRADLLAAAARGFEEAILLGANGYTESAQVGLAQALLELELGDTGALHQDLSMGAQFIRRALATALELAPANAHAASLLSRVSSADLQEHRLTDSL